VLPKTRIELALSPTCRWPSITSADERAPTSLDQIELVGPDRLSATHSQARGTAEEEAVSKAVPVEVCVRLPVFKLKLVRDGTVTFPPITLEQPQLAAIIFHRLIGQADREHSACIFLDGRGQAIGTTILSVGALTFTPLPAREVFKSAFLANASSIILGHNHPSGNCTPTPSDIRVTRRLVQAGNLLGVDVHDHIIVSPSGEFVSMMETGLLALWRPDVAEGKQNDRGVTKGSAAPLVADSPACHSSGPPVISGLPKPQKA
jgi:DNA repair protein RadC